MPALVQLPPLLTQVHQQLLQERPVTGLRGRVGWEEEEEEEEEGEEGERWRRRDHRRSEEEREAGREGERKQRRK